MLSVHLHLPCLPSLPDWGDRNESQEGPLGPKNFFLLGAVESPSVLLASLCPVGVWVGRASAEKEPVRASAWEVGVGEVRVGLKSRGWWCGEQDSGSRLGVGMRRHHHRCSWYSVQRVGWVICA